MGNSYSEEYDSELVSGYHRAHFEALASNTDGRYFKYHSGVTDGIPFLPLTVDDDEVLFQREQVPLTD